MTITFNENPLYDGNNPKWMAECEGYVHSGDSALEAVTGALNLFTSKRLSTPSSEG